MDRQRYLAMSLVDILVLGSRDLGTLEGLLEQRRGIMDGHIVGILSLITNILK